MSALDWSANGTLADEALLIGTVLTFVSSILTVVIRQGRIAKQVNNIDSNLNHVGEPVATSGPTLGQRVARIESRTDRIDQKIDRIGDSLQDLSLRMIEHISDEADRTARLERTVRQLDRRRDWEAPNEKGDTR
jgi:hypothetical protein